MCHAHWQPCFLWIGSKVLFWQGNHPTTIYVKLFWNRTNDWFILIFISFFNWFPWQPKYFMDFISFSYFQKRSPKEHSYEVWFHLVNRFRTTCCFKFYYMHIVENKPRPLTAMFFNESAQKCHFSKTITQQLFL